MREALPSTLLRDELRQSNQIVGGGSEGGGPPDAEISLFTLSAGRDEMNMNVGSRDLPGGSVSDDDGLALAKQIFFPPGDAE